MSDQLYARVLGLLATANAAPLERRLCAVCARVVGVSGAGVMVDGAHRAPLCASDETSARVGDLCLTLGEGPGRDAHRDGLVVVEPDLAQPQVARWPHFAGPAVSAGVAGIFAFPLRLGGMRLGALTLYQDRPGALSDAQHADARTMTRVVVTTLLVHQAGAPPGALAQELEGIDRAQAAVHQATGMISVQLDVSLAEALVRLRAHAYATERSLGETASDVTGRRLRLSG